MLFHVNAVQLITETHDADPAAIGAVNHFDYGATSYPVAFHALAALVADLGVNAVVATERARGRPHPGGGGDRAGRSAVWQLGFVPWDAACRALRGGQHRHVPPWT